MTRINLRSIRLVCGLLVSVLFLWVLGSRLDFKQFETTLTSVSLMSLWVALTLFTAGYAVRLVRWWWMLRVVTPRLALTRCAWPFFASFALNNLLPFRAGDALRAFGFREHLGVPVPHLTGALVIERLMDLMCVLAVCFVGLSGAHVIDVPGSVALTLEVLAVLVLLAGFGLMLFSPHLHALTRSFAQTPIVQRSRARVLADRCADLFEAFKILRGAKLSSQILGLSVLAWTLEGGVFVAVAWGVQAQPWSLGPWLSLGLGNLATLLPSSPGGVGTFDYFAMLGLHAYGTNRDTASAVAVIVHVIVWLPVTVVGLILWVWPRPARTSCADGAKE